MRLPLHISDYLTLSTSTLCFVAIVLVSLPAVCQTAPETQPNPLEQRDLLVLCLMTDGELDQVSINYSTKISDAQVKTDIQQMQQLTGWSISQVEVNTAKIAGVPEAVNSTTANFAVSSLEDSQTGLLPLNQFITAFQRFEHLQVIFIVNSPTTIAALPAVTNKWVRVGFLQSGTSYQYIVEVFKTGFTVSDLLSTPENTSSQQIERRNAMPIVAAILCFGIALYVITLLVIKSNRRKA